MLTEEEYRFSEYWLNNREREKKILRQLTAGLPWGLLLGVGIVFSLSSGSWYQRAIMVADTQMNPWVLLFAIILISMFTGFFYKRHQWDMNEQRYKEIMIKKSKQQ